MLSKTKRSLSSLCFLLIISGCGSTSSENVKSGGIRADIKAKGTNDSTVVDVELNVGSSLGTSLSLNAGDQLTAMARGVTRVLARQSFFGNISYTTTFDFNAGGTEVVVSLERPNDKSCPNSRVVMPEPFTISTPSPGQTFVKQNDIAVTWTPPATASVNMNIVFNTRCPAADGSTVFHIKSFTVADTGTTSIPVTSVLPTGPYNTAQPCSSEVDFSRNSTGTLDPNYGEGGRITASQPRTVSIVLTQ